MKSICVIASFVAFSQQQANNNDPQADGRDCTANLGPCPDPFYTNVAYYDDAACTVPNSLPPENALKNLGKVRDRSSGGNCGFNRISGNTFWFKSQCNECGYKTDIYED